LSSNVGSPTFYLDGSAQSTGDVNVWPKAYSVSVSSIPGYTFDHFSYNGGNYGSNPSTIGLFFSGTLTAHYTTTYHSLTVGSSAGGSTSQTGTQWYIYGWPAQIYAYPDGNYNFDGWYLDGNPAGSSNPITVNMYANHNLYASFSPDVQYHDITIEYYVWYGSWIYVTGGTDSWPEGNYQLNAPAQCQGFNFYCWWYDGDYRDYGQTSIWITLDSDKYFAAMYAP
jgi:uncharacterized repeat protein (TIGR02543 family)